MNKAVELGGPRASALEEVIDALLKACRALDENAPIDSEWGTCGCCDKQLEHDSECAVFLARAAILKATSLQASEAGGPSPTFDGGHHGKDI